MSEQHLLADARIRLLEGARRVIRLPRREAWAWAAEFERCQDSAFTMFVLPQEPMDVNRWTHCKVWVLVEEAEEFLTVGSRFVFKFQTLSTPPELIGEGIVEAVHQVTHRELSDLFGDVRRLF